MVRASERGMGVAVITSVSASTPISAAFWRSSFALGHAEAVLLVDHHQAQLGVAQPLGDQRVRADQQVACCRRPAPCRPGRARACACRR